jgi:tyrosine-protein phosphatase YwqE
MKELLGDRLVDFVASDVHRRRKVVTAKARIRVEKKYGLEYAEEIFNSNAEKIIKA